MTTSEARRRFPLGLTLVVIPALALLIGLGVWQVQRLHWKEGLIAEAEAAAKQPAAPLSGVIASGDAEFRHVIVDCPGLATAPYVELQTVQEGEVGVRLISACRVQNERGMGGARVYLLDRGFVAGTISARPAVAPSAEPLRIEAVVRTPPKPNGMAPPVSDRLFFTRDPAAMAEALGVTAPVAPQTLFAVASTNPEWQALKPSAPPVAFENNHLGYAATWFGLALALLGFYAALVMRRMKA